VPEQILGQVWRGYSEDDGVEESEPNVNPTWADALLRRLHGVGGTAGTFAPFSQWQKLERWAGGQEKLAEHTRKLVEKCSAAPGGLIANLPCLAFNLNGMLAFQCITCNSWHGIANTGRVGSSSPFLKAIQQPPYSVTRQHVSEQLLLHC